MHSGKQGKTCLCLCHAGKRKMEETSLGLDFLAFHSLQACFKIIMLKIELYCYVTFSFEVATSVSVFLLGNLSAFSCNSDLVVVSIVHLCCFSSSAGQYCTVSTMIGSW